MDVQNRHKSFTDEHSFDEPAMKKLQLWLGWGLQRETPAPHQFLVIG
jgi:hypothetical protein